MKRKFSSFWETFTGSFNRFTAAQARNMANAHLLQTVDYHYTKVKEQIIEAAANHQYRFNWVYQLDGEVFDMVAAKLKADGFEISNIMALTGLQGAPQTHTAEVSW